MNVTRRSNLKTLGNMLFLFYFFQDYIVHRSTENFGICNVPTIFQLVFLAFLQTQHTEEQQFDYLRTDFLFKDSLRQLVYRFLVKGGVVSGL